MIDSTSKGRSVTKTYDVLPFLNKMAAITVHLDQAMTIGHIRAEAAFPTNCSMREIF